MPVQDPVPQVLGDPGEDRFAAVATFAVTASGLEAFGLGAAFWGLLVGIALVLLDRARRRWSGP